MSKTQDLSTVASGQTRTYTVTYTNTGTTDITGLTVRDQYNLGTNATRIESSVSCAPSSTAPCPTWANGTTQSNTNTTFIYPFNNPVNLPAGTSLVLTVPVTATLGCLPTGSTSSNNTAYAFPPTGIQLNPANPSARVTGTLTTTVCPTASVSVSKTQDLSTVASGQTRTYTVTYTNTGTTDITGLTVRDQYNLGTNATRIESSVSCAPSSTAPCPTWANGTTQSNTNTTFIYPFNNPVNLPAGTSLVLTVPVTATLGCLPTGSTSSNNTAYAFPPTGIQLNPANPSARVTGTLTTTVCPTASVSVSKTQDLSTVASGQTRTYTVTYTNTGTTDITGLTVRDQYNLGTNATRIESSVSCAPSSTAPCPTWANGTTQSNTNTTFIYPFNNPVNLPAGTSLVLTVPVTATLGCLPTGSTSSNNTAYAFPPTGIQLNPANPSARVTGTLTTTVCPTASVSVSKTQDLSTVASGQTRTYTVTYTNTGTTDITGLTVRDQYNLGTNATRIESSVSCAPSSTAPCPTWANGTTQSNTNTTFIYPFNNPVNLPAGTSLVLTVPVTATLGCLPTGSTSSNNTAYAFPPTGIQLNPANPSARVTGTLRTTDITTVTRVSTSSPEPGEELTVSSEISNGCGATTNVPVTITLPKAGFTVPDGATPVCTASGGATCPTDLVYDPTSHTVTGTVTSVPSGGSVVISLTGRAGVIQSFGSSQLVTTSAPDPWDLTPSTNTSSTTYAYRNTRTDVTVIHRVEGLPATGAPEEMTFTGTLTCQASGTHSVSVTIPVGSTEARTTVPATVWLKDSCSISVEHPEAPAGLSWVSGTPAILTEDTGGG
ncbi:DUF11 domain-containing protein [Actinomyces howellii]|uniref:DUF11 domain-containing protein n=1 Tax=Actinomyces howellii TaxID=52771 RepID=UPI000F8346B8|nr:DUF11 domain-containing protein [Actinomyces howellii]